MRTMRPRHGGFRDPSRKPQRSAKPRRAERADTGFLFDNEPTPDAPAALASKPLPIKTDSVLAQPVAPAKEKDTAAVSASVSAAKPAPPKPPALPAKPLTVSALTRQLKNVIETNFLNVWVEGELSNVRLFASGHCYFTLKDAHAQISGVLWRDTLTALKFEPADGMKVVARGRLSVYEPRGNYQLVVERLELSGLGALHAAFQALKDKLEKEGLFAASLKRELPAFPQRIGLVTSPDGAALHDMLKVLRGRWPVEIILAPCRVQGEGAAAEITRALRLCNQLPAAEAPELLIVGRGGGSLEDLWAFNEEAVARALRASKIPCISAVGHQTDVTIADFVADVRAATPSHAAELAVPDREELLGRITELERALPVALLARVGWARERLQALAQHWALRDPVAQVARQRQRLDELQARLEPLPRRRLAQLKERLTALDVRFEPLARRGLKLQREQLAAYTARLEGLSPLKVLERGYSVTQRAEDGRVVETIQDIKDGAELITRLKRGRIKSKVMGTEE